MRDAVNQAIEEFKIGVAELKELRDELETVKTSNRWLRRGFAFAIAAALVASAAAFGSYSLSDDVQNAQEAFERDIEIRRAEDAVEAARDSIALLDACRVRNSGQEYGRQVAAEQALAISTATINSFIDALNESLSDVDPALVAEVREATLADIVAPTPEFDGIDRDCDFDGEYTLGDYVTGGYAPTNLPDAPYAPEEVPPELAGNLIDAEAHLKEITDA